jgi:hypothetical protein
MIKSTFMFTSSVGFSDVEPYVTEAMQHPRRLIIAGKSASHTSLFVYISMHLLFLYAGRGRLYKVLDKLL